MSLIALLADLHQRLFGIRHVRSQGQLLTYQPEGSSNWDTLTLWCMVSGPGYNDIPGVFLDTLRGLNYDQRLLASHVSPTFRALALRMVLRATGANEMERHKTLKDCCGRLQHGHV